ncbi:MAG: hypothetical protein JSV79_09710, partial [Armatimonadota bacterium]
ATQVERLSRVVTSESATYAQRSNSARTRGRIGPLEEPITYEDCVRLWREGLTDGLCDDMVMCSAAAAIAQIGISDWDEVAKLTLLVLRLDQTARVAIAHRPAGLPPGPATQVYLCCLLALSDAGRRCQTEELSRDPSRAVGLLSEMTKIHDASGRASAALLLSGARQAAARVSDSLVTMLHDPDATAAATAAGALRLVDPEALETHWPEAARSVARFVRANLSQFRARAPQLAAWAESVGEGTIVSEAEEDAFMSMLDALLQRDG